MLEDLYTHDERSLPRAVEVKGRARVGDIELTELIERAFPLKQASLDSVHEKNVRHERFYLSLISGEVARCLAARVRDHYER